MLNELREVFISWQSAAGTWIDLGRINLKSGVAVGYNPTDFFRSRAVVEPLTADPAVLREDRLGTLMLLAQHVWTGGLVTAAYAPKVTQPTAIYSDIDLPCFDPMLDRTNAEHRLLLKGSLTIANGFSPELLLYHAGDRTLIGTDLTVGLGQQTIGYVEWTGGVGGSLLDDALRYGRETGTLPAKAPSVIPGDPAQSFHNSLAAGLSVTPADTRLTFNLEYHYFEAGFTPQDWHNWFNAAARHGTIPGVDAALWVHPVLRTGSAAADVTTLGVPARRLGGRVRARPGADRPGQCGFAGWLRPGASDGGLLPVAHLDDWRLGQFHLRHAAFRLRQPAASRQHSAAAGAVSLTAARDTGS